MCIIIMVYWVIQNTFKTNTNMVQQLLKIDYYQYALPTLGASFCFAIHSCLQGRQFKFTILSVSDLSICVDIDDIIGNTSRSSWIILQYSWGFLLLSGKGILHSEQTVRVNHNTYTQLQMLVLSTAIPT